MKILCKLGEVILKGQNRHFFEKKLIENLQIIIGHQYAVAAKQGVIYIDVNDEDVQQVLDKACKVFGFASVCPAYSCEKSIDAIKAKAKELCESLSGTFKVEAKRADKKFPMTSPEIAIELGGYLDDVCPDLTVDVNNPRWTVMVEVREDESYIHYENYKGAGGLPVGSSGKAILLLSGGIDSPVAGYMMAKRGIQIDAVHFYSYPYTSLQAKQKVIDLAYKMCEYCGDFRLHIVPFTDIQLEINKNCPTDMSTIIMRVFMMQIANRIATANKSEALITGECLAQVASQTLQSLTVTDSSSAIPVLRPLIGMDKEEIVQIARNIDTFEISILPYEDCCTVFTPKHPLTKPKMEKVMLAQAILDVENLIDKALEGVELIWIKRN